MFDPVDDRKSVERLNQNTEVSLDSASETQSIAAILHGIRILLVAPSFAIMGGQSVIADLLYRSWRAEGVDVGFLPINPEPPGALRLATRVKYLRTLVVSLFYFAALFREVRKYDVIHIFSASYFSFILAPTPALLIARLCRKKSILNYHSGEADDHLARWGRWIFWIIRKADKIVVPSEYLVRVFSRYGFHAEFVYNITELDTFRYRDRPTLHPRILVPRNLEPNYDIDTSIAVFRKVKSKYPAATLTITGSGPEEGRLKELVSNLALKDVTFTGRVERSQMPKLFAASDIMLNTSLIDNMPISILEAFCAGLPVVTTDAGGIPYIVHHRENGLVLRTKDVDGLADAVKELIEDSELRSRIIDSARREIHKYSWPAVKYDWARLYRELAIGSK